MTRKRQPRDTGVGSCALTDGNTDSSVLLFQDVERPAGPDGFADCPSCDMQIWSHSQQVDDLISLVSEELSLVGIYSAIAEVSACAAKDWSSAQQRTDLVNLFLHFMREASLLNR